MDVKKIARAFPRKTSATPDDDLAFIGVPTRKLVDSVDCDEVHVSVTWTYDIPKAEQIARAWERNGATVKIGGPAFGDRMGGLYARHVHQEWVHLHESWMPKPLLVLQRSESGKRNNQRTAYTGRMEYP